MGLSYLNVAFDSVTVRSCEFWSMYIRGLTHATRNVRTQVKSTVTALCVSDVTSYEYLRY